MRGVNVDVKNIEKKSSLTRGETLIVMGITLTMSKHLKFANILDLECGMSVTGADM